MRISRQTPTRCARVDLRSGFSRWLPTNGLKSHRHFSCRVHLARSTTCLMVRRLRSLVTSYSRCADVRAIIEDDDALQTGLVPALQKYNLAQFTTVQVPGQNHSVIISEAGRLKLNDGDEPSERFVDPRSKQSFAFDHLRLASFARITWISTLNLTRATYVGSNRRAADQR